MTPTTSAATGPSPTAPVHAEREKVTHFAGTGCLIQATGVLALIAGAYLFGTLGAVVGAVAMIVLFVVGSGKAVTWRCGNCKNPLASGEVSMCPVCHAHFAPPRKTSKLERGVLVAICVAAIYSIYATANHRRPDEVGPASSSQDQAGAPVDAQTRPPAARGQSFEIGRLILLLMPEPGQHSIPWDHRSESGINWLNAGYESGRNPAGKSFAVRRGLVRANVQGATSTVLRERREELPWTVTYWTAESEKFGAQKILLEPGTPDETCFGSLYDGCSFDVRPSLAAAGIRTKQVCHQKRGEQDLTGLTLSHPDRGDIQLLVMNDGGSGGTSTSLEMSFNAAPESLCSLR